MFSQKNVFEKKISYVCDQDKSEDFTLTSILIRHLKITTADPLTFRQKKFARKSCKNDPRQKPSSQKNNCQQFILRW